MALIGCPHCGASHEASTTVCPRTGHTLASAVGRPASSRSRPPPTPQHERRVPSVPPLPTPPRPRGSVPPPPAPGARAPSVPPLEPDEAAPSVRALIGTTLGGRYRVRSILGEGGMGTVFEAEHLALGRAVAIKVLHPTQAKRRVAVQRFQNEARAAGTIGHPNICEVYDIGELGDGSPFLVMERLVGETLADRIARERVDATDLVDIMLQVLSGLHAAHQKGILHRDIKPENIFLNTRVGVGPLAKLLDFGVAKEMNPAPDAVTDLTMAGMVMGTPFYLSPEQARGERDLDQRTDLYACGVVMYEALAGTRPFASQNYNGLLRSILFADPTPLRVTRPDLPEGLESVVMSAMARERGDRYADAVALQEALVPYHAASYISSRSLPNPTSSRRDVVAEQPASGLWDETLHDPAMGERVHEGESSRGRVSEAPTHSGSLELDFDEETVRSTTTSELARAMREGIDGTKKRSR